MRNILVIDDDEVIRNLIKTILSSYNYKIEAAADGKEGIQKFDDNFFDLVIAGLFISIASNLHTLLHIPHLIHFS